MRAGHYERNLQTKAGEVRLKVPKLRQALIEELPDSATASGSRPPLFRLICSPCSVIATYPQTMKW
jgi:Transposase, Mutator family